MPHIRKHDGNWFDKRNRLPDRHSSLRQPAEPNALIGPPFKEFNFAVFKDTKMTERTTLQLRAEFFNIFNHPNFSNPNCRTSSLIRA